MQTSLSAIAIKKRLENNHFQYCQEKVAKPGSDIYYSTLFLKPLQRMAVIALRALQQEIIEISSKSLEIEIALTKFEWWKLELKHLSTRQPTHPITQLLATLPFDFSSVIPACQEMINTYISDKRIGVYETEKELSLFYQKTAGLFERQLGKIYGCDHEKTLESLEHYGIFIAVVHNLNHLREHLQQGRTYIAGETLIKHHASLQQLSNLTMNYNLQQLFHALTTKAQNLFRETENQIQKKEKKAIKSTVLLAKLHDVLLKEMIAANYPVFTHQLSLTPLRKWWITWRG